MGGNLNCEPPVLPFQNEILGGVNHHNLSRRTQHQDDHYSGGIGEIDGEILELVPYLKSTLYEDPDASVEY